MANENLPAYVGNCKTCNGFVAATVDDGTDPKGVAKFVADLVKRGYVIERKTVGYVRTNKSWCECNRAASTDTENSMTDRVSRQEKETRE